MEFLRALQALQRPVIPSWFNLSYTAHLRGCFCLYAVYPPSIPQATETEPDDPTGSYMLQAWARLCKCLGKDFLPYMEARSLSFI